VKPDLPLPRALEELVDDEPRALRPLLVDHRVERIDPLLRLGGIDVRQLLLELVEDVMHRDQWYRPMPLDAGAAAAPAARLR